VEAGTTPIGPTAAATVSGTFGAFWGGCRGVNIGSTATGGYAYTKSGKIEPGAVIGAFAGFGVGMYITNATSARDLEGQSRTRFLDLGAGSAKFSVQYAESSGKWIGSLTWGPAKGVAAGWVPTTTVVDPESAAGACPGSPSPSKSAS
jgi:hypothetical protein